MEESNLFFNQNGRFSAYAFSCGYVSFRNGRSLEKIHGLYRVNSFTENEMYFKTLKEARKYQNR